MKLTSNTRRTAQSAVKVSLAVWTLVVAGLAAPPLRAQESADDWEFAAAVYGWFRTSAAIPSCLWAGGSIDVDVSTILDHLKMTAQGSFEFQKGRWGGFTDRLSRRRRIEIAHPGHHDRRREELPAGVTAAAEFDLKSTFWTIAGKYRVVGRSGGRRSISWQARALPA